MLKNKIIKLLSVVGIISLFTLGGIFYTNHIKAPEKTTIVHEYKDKSIELEQTVINKIKGVGRMEIMQCQVGKKITISNNSKLKWFKKETSIDYKILAHYYLDFSKADIKVENNILTIQCSKPIIETNILYNLTKVSTNNGCLAFDELKLTPEEQLQLEDTLCASIAEECEEEIDSSKEFAIRAIDGLVSKINSDIIKINIVYK